MLRSGEQPLYLKRENEIHHEVELGVLIGMTGKNISAKDWQHHIEGYFIGIDFTDRDLQNTAKANGSPWTISKSQDGFFAVSGFVPAEKVRNPHDLELSLQINGKYVQRDNTRNMIFQIPTLLEYLSRYMTLRAGDMLLTGTPAGVGPVRPGDYLHAQLQQASGGTKREELAQLVMKVEKDYK